MGDTVPGIASVAEALAEIAHLRSRGAIRDAANFLRDLQEPLGSHPQLLAEHLRLFMQLGCFKEARARLENSTPAGGTEGNRLILALESLMLEVFNGGQLDELYQQAATLVAEAEGGGLTALERAQCIVPAARVAKTAHVYFEIRQDEAERWQERLRCAAQVLQEAGDVEAGLQALILLAESQPEPAARISQLMALAEQARSSQCAHLARDAQLRAAAQKLAAGDPTPGIVNLIAAVRSFAANPRSMLEADRIEALLRIRREAMPVELLQPVFDRAKELGDVAAASVILADLSRLSHERGDTAAAEVYRQQELALASEHGLSLTKYHNAHSHIDLLIRHGAFKDALDVCETALGEAGMPRVLRGTFLHFKSRCYAFLTDTDRAYAIGKQALDLFETLGADDLASNVATVLIDDIAKPREESALFRAERLARDYLAKDRARGAVENACVKLGQLAHIECLRLMANPASPLRPIWLQRALDVIEEGETLARTLAEPGRARRLGGFCQSRAHRAGIAGALGDSKDWSQQGADIFAAAGLRMEAANCHYMLGIEGLNRHADAIRSSAAPETILASFATAEQAFLAALGYYNSAGMRRQAADTRHKLAMLYRNMASIRLRDEQIRLRQAALDQLGQAERDVDDMRKAFTSQYPVDALLAKQAIVLQSHALYALALTIAAFDEGDASLTWEWCQRGKARAMTDLLARPGSSEGDVLSAGETSLAVIRGMLAAMATPGRSAIAIDWIVAGNRIAVTATSAEGRISLHTLDVSYDYVSDLLQGPLSPGRFRETLTQRPDLLDGLSPLVATIEALAKPGDLLILCPTGDLHDVPLHALTVCGSPLIARHPVLYAPCLASLTHLQNRETVADAGKVLVVGDPSGDRAIARKTAQHVADLFCVDPLLGAAATKAAFFAQARDSALIHFQGHATHNPLDPWSASLQFHDGKLTVRELLAGGPLSAGIVVLGACEARKAAIRNGDEPIGLASGILAAGARSVLAPAWPVREEAADAFMSAFYAAWTESRTAADAVQTAINEMRQAKAFGSMLDWGPYALYGASITR